MALSFKSRPKIEPKRQHPKNTQTIKHQGACALPARRQPGRPLPPEPRGGNTDLKAFKFLKWPYSNGTVFIAKRKRPL